MKKIIHIFLLTLSLGTAVVAGAQATDDKEENKGFQKENLFTGGSISLAISSNSFLVGGTPVFGYSLTRWADLGVVVNYTYTSYRDVYAVNDKLRQKVYGGGGFARIFPVKFLFAQAQFEHNWVKYVYHPAPGNASQKMDPTEANSFLIGAGYSTGRDPDFKKPYGYLAILFDVTRNANSPYLDYLGRTIPVIRAGVHIPLFQKSGRDF